MKYKKTTLPNGLRVITVPVKSPAVTVFVLVEAGSNYESKAQNGLSHFLEHMCFKGTARRPSSLHIARELDALGAENNAFTGNEMTGYYAKAERKHFKKILDVVSDIYLNPVLPATDLEKERGVILQEISMYEDEPKRKVWDILDELMYGDVPAGRTILGPAENIKKFKREDFVNYRNSHYIAGKTIVVVAGDIAEKAIIEEVKKRFKNIPNGRKLGKDKVVERQKSPALKVYRKKTDQAHMLVSFRTVPARDKRTATLDVLSHILGQGMSSRLFYRLREVMGACYYVFSISKEYTSHGFFTIATGIEAKRSEEVLKAVLAECTRLKKELVTHEELEKAKEHYLGHLYMQLETSDAQAEFYAAQEIATGKPKVPREIEREVRKVTPEAIRKVAQEFFRNDRLNLAAVGDLNNGAKLRKILKV